jgi:hypothetical protein
VSPSKEIIEAERARHAYARTVNGKVQPMVLQCKCGGDYLDTNASWDGHNAIAEREALARALDAQPEPAAGCKVGDRVAAPSGRLGTVLGFGDVLISVRWDGSDSAAWTSARTLRPAPPEPPTLLEAAKAVLDQTPTGWGRHLPHPVNADLWALRAAVEREAGK